jgi:CO dehydrogenase maturation factor
MATIAIAGKGGTGKTTLCGLIVRWLQDHKKGTILAVDADSNVNLNDLVGVRIKQTIGSIREEMRRKLSALPGGMSKQQFLEYKIQSSLVETPGFDLLAMGRPEGPGCYCYANDLLRDILKNLGEHYDYVIIDNEAGMEHLSRRTVQRIDDLLIVADPSSRGITAAGRISRLLEELDSRVGKKFLVLNRAGHSLDGHLEELIRDEGLELLAAIPEDDALLKADRAGAATWTELPNFAAYRETGRMLEKLGV